MQLRFLILWISRRFLCQVIRPNSILIQAENAGECVMTPNVKILSETKGSKNIHVYASEYMKSGIFGDTPFTIVNIF
jgi:hypothetical protein